MHQLPFLVLHIGDDDLVGRLGLTAEAREQVAQPILASAHERQDALSHVSFLMRRKCLTPSITPRAWPGFSNAAAAIRTEKLQSFPLTMPDLERHFLQFSQKPIDQVWQLVENKLTNNAGRSGLRRTGSRYRLGSSMGRTTGLISHIRWSSTSSRNQCLLS